MGTARLKNDIMNALSRSTSLALAAISCLALTGLAHGQTSGQSPPSPRGQAPALSPDAINPAVRVLVTQAPDGTFEATIGNATFRSTNWVEIEKRSIELLPDRTITFVNPKGEVLHVSPRAMFGVLLEPATGALAAQLNVKPGEALIVTEVQPNLPAAKAGLEIYDVIVECNGRRPMTNTQFSEIMAAALPGDTINVVLVRRGRETEIEVRLVRYDPVAMAAVRQPTGSVDFSGKSREQILRELLQSTETASKRPGTTYAVPKNDDQAMVLQLPGASPQFPDPNSKALQEELVGIKAQLRRIEEVLLDLLLLEQQRQSADAKTVGG